MPIPRSVQVDLGATPYYHCMSRCVRRAFLCGKDSVTGKSFEHRRGWIRERLLGLAEVFAIDVCAYAVMSNHLHVVVHVDEARARGWSDDEVVERYCSLFKLAKSSLAELSSVAAREERLALWRERLCDLSWMMRALNGWIARKANKEDGVRGHFWESRFKSQPLLDEKGLLTCMAYVDLNPVRAGLSKSLEKSDFTSIQDRLAEVAKNKRQKRKQKPPANLAPFEPGSSHVNRDAERRSKHTKSQHGESQHGESQHGESQHGESQHGESQHGESQHGESQHGESQHGESQRAEFRPFESREPDAPFRIPFDLASYVEVLEWAGRQFVPGKRGRLETPELMHRLGLSPAGWLDALRSRRLSTATFLGSPSSIESMTRRRGGQWSRGIAIARRLAA